MTSNLNPLDSAKIWNHLCQLISEALFRGIRSLANPASAPSGDTSNFCNSGDEVENALHH